jgi:Protein of unknown function (DUF2789)
MDTSTHSLSALFAQLGLADDRAAIEAFIAAHRPLRGALPLCDAPFWNASQASFLREALRQDAEWSQPVDELAALLSR